MKNDKLLELLKSRNYAAIRSELQVLPEKEKGRAFELFLAELYQGNGWLVEVKGGRSDHGADIQLYHPKTPTKSSYIIQAKNHSKPLTFDQTRLELIKFEEQAARKYDCQQFRLVALNGFVKEAQKLGRFNLSLKDWEHLAGLISKYDPRKITEPQIDLYAHNETTYQRVRELSMDSRQVAVVQATGTGKSYLIAKVMADFLADKKLVMAPQKYILQQQQTKVPWANQSTKFMTYAKAMHLTETAIKSLAPKLIVLDEFHRCGAEEWGKGVERILKAHPKAFVFGTTATPIRWLDESRDMSDELFGGTVAEDLSLAQAIARRILPSPDYVAALYTLDEEIEDLEEKLKDSSKPEAEKKQIEEQIRQSKIAWEKSKGIPEILKKHLNPEINKFIIFCKDKQHLDQMEWVVESWFQKAGLFRRRKKYHLLSGDQENDQNLREFREAKARDTAHLMFAIDMLNEGIHIPEVGAVILLRPTESPIVFFQQIGRCIQVGVDHTPIIFDFVNNFQNIRANDFLRDLQEAREQEAKARKELGLEEYAPSFHITDETKEIRELFDRISERLQPWEVMFQQLVEFKKRFGHCKVPRKWEENRKLVFWVVNQRVIQDRLPFSKRAKLESIGFDWDPVETAWKEMFSKLLLFKQKQGHCNVPSTWKENRALAIWVTGQRCNKNQLSHDRVAKLNSIGFDWDPLETTWNQMFKQLEDFKKKHGHCNVPAIYKINDQLGRWVNTQRNTKDSLSPERKARLDFAGFDWDPHETTWSRIFEQLEAFKKKYGHCNVPQGYKAKKELGSWVRKQRSKRDMLSRDKIAKLDMIGFDWDPHETTWRHMYQQLKAFKVKYGHCNVPKGWKENKQLGTWVVKQRSKKDSLSPDKISQLDFIGFDWGRFETAWNQMFEKLVDFNKKHGHCNVPRGLKENRQLGTWADAQRNKKNSLSPEKRAKLDSIGFDWDPRETLWNHMFERLVDFKKKYGYCNVPQNWKENKELGKWVVVQRSNKDSLSPERRAKLDSIGFDWDPYETYWNQMFEQLAKYKAHQGHCNVPRGDKEYRQLGSWISNQRSRTDSLSPEKKAKLDSIGFKWSRAKKAG